ncbi:hypothetical protein Rwratislav_03188 [Rhodococcus wratislaviensis IFP 2016]|nr:hypothetical protein Rwratislav_03188 [Rhodococcus wratislaviensis IFP 2016]
MRWRSRRVWKEKGFDTLRSILADDVTRPLPLTESTSPQYGLGISVRHRDHFSARSRRCKW